VRLLFKWKCEEEGVRLVSILNCVVVIIMKEKVPREENGRNNNLHISAYRRRKRRIQRLWRGEKERTEENTTLIKNDRMKGHSSCSFYLYVHVSFLVSSRNHSFDTSLIRYCTSLPAPVPINPSRPPWLSSSASPLLLLLLFLLPPPPPPPPPPPSASQPAHALVPQATQAQQE